MASGVAHTLCGEQDMNDGLQRRLQDDMDTCAMSHGAMLGACAQPAATVWEQPVPTHVDWPAEPSPEEPAPAGPPRALLLLALLALLALLFAR
jgi:hypothetical protein